MLALLDFIKPFEIETDASRFGIRVVLTQQKCPLAYYIHTLSVCAHAKPVYEREMMDSIGFHIFWDRNLL